MHSLMNIAAIPSVQRLTAVELLAYNIRGNPCSRDMVYREIRFDILNVKCNDIGGIAARRFLFCVQQDIRHTSAAGPKYVLHSIRYLRQEHACEASRRVHYAVASQTHT